MEFINTLGTANEELFIFGGICLILAVLLIIISFFSPIQVKGTNAWYKPIKFALSTWVYAWAMGYFTGHLSSGWHIDLFNWAIIITLSFEIIYITFQAARGQLSHFNLSTPLYSALYSLMAIAATVATLFTAYIGVLFFTEPIPELSETYLWSIRLGIILFVIFALEGFVMGSRLSHTIGAEDGGKGLPFLNWSTKFGDPRVAHFIGMHALQVLPLLATFLVKDLWLILLIALLYAALAFWVLFQALNAQPLIKIE